MEGKEECKFEARRGENNMTTLFQRGDEAHCWKLHLELRPKKPNNKGKKKTTETTQKILDLIQEMKPRYLPWLTKERKKLRVLVPKIVTIKLQMRIQG